MPPEPAQVVPVGYLLIAIGALTSTVGVLFYALLAAKKESLELAREVLPVIAVLTKMIEKWERDRGGQP